MGQREYRARVACLLPLSNEHQAYAIQSLVDYLKDEGREALQVEGFTLSDPYWPTWIGYCYSSDRRDWVKDRLVCCYIDVRSVGGLNTNH